MVQMDTDQIRWIKRWIEDIVIAKIYTGLFNFRVRPIPVQLITIIDIK